MIFLIDTEGVKRALVEYDFKSFFLKVHNKHVTDLVIDFAAGALLHLLNDTRLKIERNHIVAHDSNVFRQEGVSATWHQNLGGDWNVFEQVGFQVLEACIPLEGGFVASLG